MSAFDEARTGNATTARRQAPRAGLGSRGPSATLGARAGSGLGDASAGAAADVAVAVDGYQSSDTAYASLCASIEADLGSVSQLAAQLRKQKDLIGTKADGDDLRSKMTSNITSGVGIVKRVESTLRTQFAALADAGAGAGAREAGARKIQQKKFASDLGAIAKAFQEASVAAKRAAEGTPAPSGARGGASASDSTADAARSKRAEKAAREEEAVMAQLQQVDLSEALISEREGNIDAITTEVVAVNEVMRDLAHLVESQGEMLDTVENNVGGAKDATEKGVGFLHEAAKYAGRYRWCLCGFLILLILIAGGVTAYFVVSANKAK